MQVQRRLEVLERHLRSASEGRAKLSDYAAWLEQAGTSVPGRQTLYMDLRRYCQACDDLNYPEYQKILEIDPHTGTDAIRYFLGEPWLASPLKPRLSSSVARCLLLAMHLKYEVEFPYAAVPEPGTPPSFKLWRGIPLKVLPGADSGYMAIWLVEGQVMHINLARILGRVAKTSQAGSPYRAPAPEQQVTLKVFAHDPYALDRCEMQFRGGRRIGAQELHFPLPASQAAMTADLLEAWWRRTSRRERHAERQIELNGTRIIFNIEEQRS